MLVYCSSGAALPRCGTIHVTVAIFSPVLSEEPQFVHFITTSDSLITITAHSLGRASSCVTDFTGNSLTETSSRILNEPQQARRILDKVPVALLFGVSVHEDRVHYGPVSLQQPPHQEPGGGSRAGRASLF